MSTERLATELTEEATVSEKAAEIATIALELSDALDLVYNTDGGEGTAGFVNVAKRILLTVEGLANEIHYAAAPKQPAVAVAGKAPTKRRAGAR
jgi:hypothetical protein